MEVEDEDKRVEVDEASATEIRDVTRYGRSEAGDRMTTYVSGAWKLSPGFGSTLVRAPVALREEPRGLPTLIDNALIHRL